MGAVAMLTTFPGGAVHPYNFSRGCFSTPSTPASQGHAFRVIFGDDKRKAVLIRGLETPFRDAERRLRLSPLFF